MRSQAVMLYLTVLPSSVIFRYRKGRAALIEAVKGRFVSAAVGFG